MRGDRVRDEDIYLKYQQVELAAMAQAVAGIRKPAYQKQAAGRLWANMDDKR